MADKNKNDVVEAISSILPKEQFKGTDNVNTYREVAFIIFSRTIALVDQASFDIQGSYQPAMSNQTAIIIYIGTFANNKEQVYKRFRDYPFPESPFTLVLSIMQDVAHGLGNFENLAQRNGIDISSIPIKRKKQYKALSQLYNRLLDQLRISPEEHTRINIEEEVSKIIDIK